MNKPILVGIRKETKTHQERRAPVTPQDVAALTQESSLQFCVQPSEHRVYRESEYQEAGATITPDLSGCNLILGIKEVPPKEIQPQKAHLFFSHTIKKQPFNMPMLKRFLDTGSTLMDYECVVDNANQRLIFFGVQAGQAGMINSLWSLGQRLKALGFPTSLAELTQARHYDTLADAKEAIKDTVVNLDPDSIPESLRPLTFGITGGGNVSKGAQEILSLLDPLWLRGEVLVELAKNNALDPNKVYASVLDIGDLVTRLDNSGSVIDPLHYYKHPEQYVSGFERYVPHLSVLLHGAYWDFRYPKLLTQDFLKEHFASTTPPPKLLVVGDVTCDVMGSMECTVRATYPEDPVYVYNPETATERDGFDGPGLLVMAVEILPTELPHESSEAFSGFLKPYLPNVASTNFARPLDQLGLPEPFERSVIAHNGQLAPTYRYILQ